MHNCDECRYYYYERDTNFHDCKKNAENKYWDRKEVCPHFEGHDYEDYEPEQRDE